MKKSIKAILIANMAACFTFSIIPFTALASDVEYPTLPTEWGDIGYEKIIQQTVEDLNGDGIDTGDIQYALDIAATMEDKNLLEVTIPEGTYTLYWPLTIYSNTHLILEKETTLKKSADGQGGEMLMGGSTNVGSATMSGEYNAISNVFIEGGTWDANKDLAGCDLSNIFLFNHAENLVFRNITFSNSVNHMLNISGSNKVLVDNCTFSDSQIYTGNDASFYPAGTDEEAKIARHNPIEAIHLDFMNAAGEGGILDGTPCQNITVTNCTFDNVFRGLGTHHTISFSPNDDNFATDYASKIKVENNVFNNVRAACISGYSFKDMTIKNNSATNVGCFCEFLDAHDSLISGNTITGSVKPADYEKYVNILSPLYIQSCSGITISGNSIASDEKIHSNIMISESSSDIAIDSNKLSGAQTTCIFVENSSNIVVNNISEEKKNTYVTSGENDLYAKNSSITIGYDAFCKNICITEASATISNCTLNGGYILLAKAHKTTIQNCTIDSTDSNITACVLVMECDDDVTISGNTLSTAGNNCIYVDNTIEHNITISSNTFLKTSKYMVFAANSDGITITGNIMDNPTSTYTRAINANNCDININKNCIDKYTESGIVVKGKSTASISENTINGGVNTLQIFENSTVTVSKNTFKNTSSFPVQAMDSTGTFENNTVSGSGDVGMIFLGCKNLTINKNDISDTSGHGMYLDNVDTATLSNNTFSKIPNYKYRIRVTDSCKNITITPDSDKEYVTPTQSTNPSTPPTQSPTTPPTQAPTTPPTQTPTKAPEKEVSFEDFVERLYVVALERNSESEGKAYWCEKVKDGTYDGAYCARFFLTSPEFLGKNKTEGEFVDTLYRTFFGREADDEGRNFWIKKIHESSKEAVIEGFINSEEWCNICASYGVKSGAHWAKASVASKNATDFATRLYTECLGRPAEEGGLKYWSLSLTNLERTGSQAAREFFYSEEFIGHKYSNEEYVTRMYKTFMGREPEGDGKAYWIDYLNKGGSRDDMFNFFSTCPEFTEICAKYSIER